MKKDREFTLNIGIPNGIILTVIGILVLVTPIVHPMDKTSVLIDILAGIILIGGGSISLYTGIKNMRKSDRS
ncbi:hypothetical protein ACFL60_06285 [Candidatus Omnitrophota bacterium]